MRGGSSSPGDDGVSEFFAQIGALLIDQEAALGEAGVIDDLFEPV